MRITLEFDPTSLDDVGKAQSILDLFKTEKSAPKKPKKVQDNDVKNIEVNEEEVVENDSGNDEGTTLQDLRDLVSKKAKEYRSEIKDKLADYGVKNISSLNKKHYDEMYDFLSDLDG